MLPEVQAAEPRERRFLLGLAAFSLFVWGQLAVAALFATVSSWDSYAYNIFRLELMDRQGLFGLRDWFYEPQLYMPLAFDAVHYPFLKLGSGFALPSFLCLTGLLAVAWTMALENYGRRAAWLCVFLLLCLPHVLLQAVNTKNDLAVVFGAACWLYALYRYERGGRLRYLALCALALAFTAGTKTTALALLGLLAPLTLWRLRGRGARPVLVFAGSLLLCLALWGSLETYLNNVRVFGAPLGPQDVLDVHRNNDGLRGALASLVRVLFENSYYMPLMLDSITLRGQWTDACSAALSALGLRDAGYARLHHRGEADMFMFFYNPPDACCNYELAGPLLLLFGLAGFLASKDRAVRWLLAAGWAWLLIVSLGAGWQAYGTNRYIMLSFALFAAAFALWLSGRPFLLRAGAAACLALNALAFQHEAASAAAALRSAGDRTAHTRYRLGLHDRITALHAADPGVPWVLVGGWNTPAFSFPYSHPDINWLYLRDPAGLAGRLPPGADRAYVVATAGISFRHNKIDGLRQVYARNRALAALPEGDPAFELLFEDRMDCTTRVLLWRRPAAGGS